MNRLYNNGIKICHCPNKDKMKLSCESTVQVYGINPIGIVLIANCIQIASWDSVKDSVKEKIPLISNLFLLTYICANCQCETDFMDLI